MEASAEATPIGVAGGSSRVFSMTAAIVSDGSQTKILQAMEVVRATLKRAPSDLLHWQNIKQHGQRRYVAETLASLSELTVVNVVICKWHMRSRQRLSDPERLYNWTFRLMIERLSWFAHARGDQISVTFAQVRGLDPKRLASYLAYLRTAKDTYIEWANLKMPAKVNTPANCRMLQVADLASGACFAAFNPDAFGYTEQAYLQALKTRVWCRPHRKLWQEGLKVAPWPNSGARQNTPGWPTSVDPEDKKARAVGAALKAVSLFPATDGRSRTFVIIIGEDEDNIHHLPPVPAVRRLV